MDRLYTSVALAIQLLLMGFYSIETIMTTRLAFCKDVIDKRKKRPDQVQRGAFKMATSMNVPHMTATSWMDSKPVHFLAVGGCAEIDRVARRDRTGTQHEVPCPRFVKDYHHFMGGVDVHDQLRLQRYSLQRAVTYRNYYKSLFLGWPL